MKSKSLIPLGILTGAGRRPTAEFCRQWGLVAELGCLLGWIAIPAATAQNPAVAPIVASRSVAIVAPGALGSHLGKPVTNWVTHFADRPNGGLIAPHRAATEFEAWEKFAAEYQPKSPNASLVKRQIEIAKYGLDTSVFAVDRFVKNIREELDFEFNQGRFRRTRADTRGDFLDNPRVKLDLNLTQAKPYIGARVVIPFGH